MIWELAPGQAYSEYVLVTNIIILTLSIELSVYFIFQKIKEPDRTPTWIFSFTAFFAIIALLQFSTILFKTMGDDLFILIPSFGGIFITFFARDFFKRKGKVMQIFMVFLVGYAACFSVIFLICTIISIPLGYLMWFVAGVLLLDILLPVYFIFQILRRASSKIPFLFIFLGLLLDGLGITFNSSPLGEQFKNTIFSGMDNAFTIFISLLIIISLGMVASGFYFLPFVEDLFWEGDVVAIYILELQTNTIIYKKIIEKGLLPEEGHDDKGAGVHIEHEGIFVGGLGGIKDLLSVVTTSSGEKLEYIDQGDLKLILTYEQDLMFLVMAKHYLPILKYKLYNLKESFLMYFGDIVRDANLDDKDKFLPVEKIIENLFEITSDKEK
ncbi:MAG: hypothetical protein ACFFCS_15515 [Candidatus Hodarchaeota archaeon]